jgi:hypothetical protein
MGSTNGDEFLIIKTGGGGGVRECRVRERGVEDAMSDVGENQVV